VIDQYQHVLGEQLGNRLGWTDVDLDSRFASVRSGETNIGNFVVDVWR